jgi:hypothetical protein
MSMTPNRGGRQLHAGHPIRIFLFVVPSLIMLLASTIAAMPAGSQSWTEEPWTGANAPFQETRETTLSDPVTTNISCNRPQFILIADAQYNYSDYVSGTISPGSNFTGSELWIVRDGVWCRYDQVNAGDNVELILHTPQDGNCDLYLISYANSTIAHWNIRFLADYYYRLDLVPEQSGRLFLLLVQGSEIGGALVLDVQALQDTPSPSASNLEDIRIGEALITIKSERIRGYDVYVDGVFFSSDMSDGSMDGCARFTVGGGKTHTITVSERDGWGNTINKNEHTKSFQRDTAYTLWIT